MLKEGSMRLRALAFTSLGHFSNDFTTLLFSVLIIYYNKDFGLSLALLGVVAIAYNTISGFLSTPVGRFADRTRMYRGLMATGIAILGLSMILFAMSFVSGTFIIPAMLAAAILLGIGEAFYHPLGASVLNMVYSDKSASALGINGSFGSIGRSLLPIVLIPLILKIGEFYALLILGAYAMLAGMAIFLGLGFLKAGETRKTDTTIKAANNRKALRRYRPMLVILVAMVFVRAMFLLGTTTYISEYLLNQTGSEIMVSYVLTLSFVAAILGQPVFGKLTDMYGGKATIGITTVFSALLFFLFMLSGSDLALIIVFYAIFIFLSFTGFPVLLGYVNQIVPKDITTTAHGMVWGIGNTVGGAAGIAVMSILLYLGVSLTHTMWAMLAFGIASICFIPFIPEGGKNRMK
ncbi:MAG: MFS transporter [Candidatus Marsarchaeota archaeon]|jgi:MFS family permease|nr:MFS transporter [Candidatus Marsarchaeota archaeon]